ncbi:MAG: alpha/beta hydrolase [Sedimentitalea sp.]|nr:alpha/beta hydrolase [Sedimentitalea sp.]
MIGASGIDWEDAFANATYIADGAGYPALWAARAARFRDGARQARIDLAYGAVPRERFDLFLPENTPKGLAVFVHGGFWQAFDKSSWSHLAGGALNAGWAVALPSYTLAPEATLPEMTQQIARAVAAAADMVSGPLRLAGHSAGGHLVTRMICDDAPLAPDVLERIEHVLSISGLHDLRPLRLHSMNRNLRLTEASAAAESAALHAPLGSARVTAWVGSLERPEFLRQSALLAERWRDTGARARLVVAPERHHFDVIDGLAEASSPLTRALLDGAA